MACVKSSSLTDGARRRLMMPPAKTVGTNVNCTPKGLYSVVMTGTPPVPPGCTVGTGNSPPARKEAVSPESAIKSGSARRRTRPFVSSADRVTSRLPPLVARLASATPKGTAAAPEIAGSKVAAVLNIGRPGAPLPAGEPGAGTGFPLASTQGGSHSQVGGRQQVCPPRRPCPGRSRSLGSPRCLPQTNSPRFRGSRCGRPQEIGP